MKREDFAQGVTSLGTVLVAFGIADRDLTGTEVASLALVAWALQQIFARASLKNAVGGGDVRRLVQTGTFWAAVVNAGVAVGVLAGGRLGLPVWAADGFAGGVALAVQLCFSVVGQWRLGMAQRGESYPEVAVESREGDDLAPGVAP